MTVWVIHHTLTPEDEKELLSRSEITLPFDGVPDLSQVTSQSQMRSMLQKLEPEAPPESILLKLDRLWQQFSTIAVDDVVAVPMPASAQVAVARVSGHYRYRTGEDGSDIHTLPVAWYPKTYPLSSFGKFRHIFSGGQRMMEVSDKDARAKILDKLPHSYNRFSKLKWIALILVFLHASTFIIRMLNER